jgi:hypothetical protein
MLSTASFRRCRIAMERVRQILHSRAELYAAARRPVAYNNLRRDHTGQRNTIEGSARAQRLHPQPERKPFAPQRK